MTVDTAGFHEAHRELREQYAELRLVAERLPELGIEEREETRPRSSRICATGSSRTRNSMSCCSTRRWQRGPEAIST
jgi:hypothetical protein